jgi:phosphoribosylaminoimidazole-succinocarboxamide synthase
MEFGIRDGNLLLIDELLTPDSSRFWPKDEYQPGGSQKSFDKQFLRDYLLSLRWNKQPPAPQLPEEVIQKTREKYLEAYERLVGSPL